MAQRNNSIVETFNARKATVKAVNRETKEARYYIGVRKDVKEMLGKNWVVVAI